MNSLQLNRRFANGLLILLAFTPLIYSVVAAVLTGQIGKSDSVWPLQVLLMGFYNIPCLLLAFIAMSVGNSYVKKQNYIAGEMAYSVSCFISVIGIGVMALWGVLG